MQLTMITGPLRRKIDKLWEEFWTGGITFIVLMLRMLKLKSSGTEITRLGKMLLKYLDLIPEWYQR